MPGRPEHVRAQDAAVRQLDRRVAVRRRSATLRQAVLLCLRCAQPTQHLLRRANGGPRALVAQPLPAMRGPCMILGLPRGRAVRPGPARLTLMLKWACSRPSGRIRTSISVARAAVMSPGRSGCCASSRTTARATRRPGLCSSRRCRRRTARDPRDDRRVHHDAGVHRVQRLDHACLGTRAGSLRGRSVLRTVSTAARPAKSSGFAGRSGSCRRVLAAKPARRFGEALPVVQLNTASPNAAASRCVANDRWAQSLAHARRAVVRRTRAHPHLVSSSQLGADRLADDACAQDRAHLRLRCWFVRATVPDADVGHRAALGQVGAPRAGLPSPLIRTFADRHRTAKRRRLHAVGARKAGPVSVPSCHPPGGDGLRTAQRRASTGCLRR